MKKTAFLVVAILLLGLIFSLPATAQVPLPGKAAPMFTLPDLDGANRSLAEYRGKVVLLAFWATWCTSCLAEMPALDKLHADYQGKAFSVLSVSLDGRTGPVRDFLRKKNLSLPVLMDSEKEASFDLYAVTALPAAFLIGPDGLILERFIGEQDWCNENVRKIIDAALAGKERRP